MTALSFQGSSGTGRGSCVRSQSGFARKLAPDTMPVGAKKARGLGVRASLALRRGQTGLPHTVPSQFVPFLAQRLGQARTQIVGRLAARILSRLVALLHKRRRFLQKLLPDRLAIESLDFA